MILSKSLPPVAGHLLEVHLSEYAPAGKYPHRKLFHG